MEEDRGGAGVKPRPALEGGNAGWMGGTWDEEGAWPSPAVAAPKTFKDLTSKDEMKDLNHNLFVRQCATS